MFSNFGKPVQIPHEIGDISLYSFDIGGQTLWFLDDVRIRSYTHLQQLTRCNDECLMILRLKYGDFF